MNALRILARVTGKSPGEVKLPAALCSSSSPVALSRTRLHTRRTPLHSRHAALGAQFMLAGVWRRPGTTPNLEELGQLHLGKLRPFAPVSGSSMWGDAGEIELVRGCRFPERVYTGRYLYESRHNALCIDAR